MPTTTKATKVNRPAKIPGNGLAAKAQQSSAATAAKKRSRLDEIQGAINASRGKKTSR